MRTNRSVAHDDMLTDTACDVLSAARHVRWSERVLATLQQEAPDAFSFHRLACGPGPGPGPVGMGSSARLLLAFATPDSVATVTRALQAMGPRRLPTLLVTRGLQAAAVDQLLDGLADDFLAHDFSADEFISRAHRLIAAASATARQAAAARSLPVDEASPTASPRALDHLVGTSPAFRAQIDRIPTMAASRASVLIVGDTGTGKELCAQAIHYQSPRASGPWIAVNCAALPADLVEAELFGHTRGAFTSAHQSAEGLIAQAEGGTLFLDEIDSLPLLSQAKLLRFLQEHEYRPLGASAVRTADVRVVAACNADLAAKVEQGGFRRDLYFRLAVLTIKLPSLRERPSDIGVLADHFVAQCARELGCARPRLSTPARRAMAAHGWPGNVRELEHCIERAVLFCQNGEINPIDLDLLPASDGEALAEDADSFQAAKARVIEDFERRYIEQLLRQHHGNISQAAVAASKNRRAFWELMRRRGIDAGRYRSEGDVSMAG